MNETTARTIGDSILIKDLSLENQILKKEKRALKQRAEELEENDENMYVTGILNQLDGDKRILMLVGVDSSRVSSKAEAWRILKQFDKKADRKYISNYAVKKI